MRKAIYYSILSMVISGLCLTAPMALADILDRPFFRAGSVVVVIGASDFRENSGQAPVAVDFNLLDNVPSGQAAPDIIGADGVGLEYYSSPPGAQSDGSAHTNELLRIEAQTSGGALTNAAPFDVLDASDSLTAFGLNANTNIDMQSYYRINKFYVASNAPFDIYAQASNLTTTGDFTSMGLDKIRYLLLMFTSSTGGWGTRAQNPGIGGSGRNYAIRNLSDMSAAPTKVYGAGRRTARSPGTLMQQAVTFIPIYYIYDGGGNAYDFSQGIGTISATVTYSIYAP